MANDLERVLHYCDALDRFDENEEPVVRTAIAVGRLAIADAVIRKLRAEEIEIGSTILSIPTADQEA